MNRIQHESPSVEEISFPLLFEADAPSEPFVAVPSRAASCALFAPLHYEPNYSYPLLVWLHGHAESDKQLNRIMPSISLRNYVAVAPRGTLSLGLGSADGFTWEESDEHEQVATQQIFDSMDAAFNRFNIASDRVFVAGHDTGGTMAFRVAMRNPRSFAGVLSIGGAFPRLRAPLSRVSESRYVPLFLACHRESRRYSTTHVCDDLRLFHSAGMSVTLRQYPGGDGLSGQVLADMDRWIMEQIAATHSKAECAGRSAN